jgi:hypothetical protein
MVEFAAWKGATEVKVSEITLFGFQPAGSLRAYNNRVRLSVCRITPCSSRRLIDVLLEMQSCAQAAAAAPRLFDLIQELHTPWYWQDHITNEQCGLRCCVAAAEQRNYIQLKN